MPRLPLNRWAAAALCGVLACLGCAQENPPAKPPVAATPEPAAPTPEPSTPVQPTDEMPAEPAATNEPTDTPAAEPSSDPAPTEAPEKPAAPEPTDEPAKPEEPAEPAEKETPEEGASTGYDPVAETTKRIAELKVKPGDWPQWGGSSLRNNTPEGKNIPTDWDISTGKNIKWSARLGSQTYGNPAVANGQVYVGTNNGNGYLKRYPARVDLGCLVCFDEETGKFLWQHSSEKLPTGRVHDWPLQGICVAPFVDGDRLWFVSSRGEVVCLDTAGFHDGKDNGPVTNELAKLGEIRKAEDPAEDQFAPTLAALKEGKVSEALAKALAPYEFGLDDAKVSEGPAGSYTVEVKSGEKTRPLTVKLTGPVMTVFKTLGADDLDEADVIWKFNMMDQLQVSQHNMCSCSLTCHGEWLFVNTSNGVDEGHATIPSPSAPSFICMDRNTGSVLWTDNSPGENVLHGQWSSPTYAELGGQAQVLFGGGDGWLYSFDPAGEEGKSKLLWKFDCNPKESIYTLGGRATRNHLIGTPVVYDGMVYIAVGEDPEHGEGVGHLWCIDPTKRGDVSPELVYNKADPEKVIPHKRLQACVPAEGDFTKENPNNAAVWHYSTHDANGNGKISFEETMHRTIGTVAIKKDLLFVVDFSGLVHCVNAKTGEVHWTDDMLAASWGSPLIVEDHVYIGDEDGDVTIYELSAELTKVTEEPLSLRNSVYTSPVVANNTLFISNKDVIFAIVEGAQSEPLPPRLEAEGGEEAIDAE